MSATLYTAHAWRGGPAGGLAGRITCSSSAGLEGAAQAVFHAYFGRVPTFTHAGRRSAEAWDDHGNRLRLDRHITAAPATPATPH